MSLQEAYSLAQIAQCRLNLAASRPDRSLRFVVGHLMHYESLRLRIVEIELDISQRQRERAVRFAGFDHAIDHRGQRKPSTGQLGRKTPPPLVGEASDHIENIEDTEDDGFCDDDDLDGEFLDKIEDQGLGLQRFPSGSIKTPHSPPDLEPDDYDYYDEDDHGPVSPGEPDQTTLEQAMHGDGKGLVMTICEGTRKCVCHEKSDTPQNERLWRFPVSENEGVGAAGLKAKAVAQVA